MSTATAKPGTPEFRSRLLQALKERFPDSAHGTIELTQGEWASRNTVIFYGTLGSQDIVAKVHATKPHSVVKAEYHLLRRMERSLDGHQTRGLRPLVLIEDLGVLVTVREYGENLRDVIATACVEPGKWAWAVCGIEAAACALRTFHERLSQSDRPGELPSPHVRWYLDFSPKNLLIERPTASGTLPNVVLMDPPEEERWGSEREDIGAFCYGLTRIRFLPSLVWRPAAPLQIDRLKARFIDKYFGPLEPTSIPDLLSDIKAAEYRRASQALSWYMRPFRYRSPAKELLRLCYLGPLTVAYRVGGLDRSYRRVGRLLRERAR